MKNIPWHNIIFHRCNIFFYFSVPHPFITDFVNVIWIITAFLYTTCFKCWTKIENRAKVVIEKVSMKIIPTQWMNERNNLISMW